MTNDYFDNILKNVNLFMLSMRIKITATKMSTWRLQQHKSDEYFFFTSIIALLYFAFHDRYLYYY